MTRGQAAGVKMAETLLEWLHMMYNYKTAIRVLTACVDRLQKAINDDEFNEAERQLETYLSSTHTATIGLVTDGDRVKSITTLPFVE